MQRSQKGGWITKSTYLGRKNIRTTVIAEGKQPAEQTTRRKQQWLFQTCLDGWDEKKQPLLLPAAQPISRKEILPSAALGTNNSAAAGQRKARWEICFKTGLPPRGRAKLEDYRDHTKFEKCSNDNFDVLNIRKYY